MLRTLVFINLMFLSYAVAQGTLSGEKKQWHRNTITFEGPQASETGNPNPFTDYRLMVTFAHAASGTTIVVPGFYAADGDAGESGAVAGNKWRVHFSPNQTGNWTYTASFRTGAKIALDAGASAGTATGFDGATGAFSIAASDKQVPDLRARGLLQYVGKRYWQFAGDKTYWLKGGVDSPENYLGYFEFDQTTDQGGHSTGHLKDGLHRYEPHVKHWKDGDPTWHNGKGKGIIGSINYLSSLGGNSIYFITYNLDGGDGADTWMWESPKGDKTRFDVSKLDQWEIVFSHMEAKGVAMHVLTQEVENDRKLSGGNLGEDRQLYYRELIARFSHHQNVLWNLGEENKNTDSQLKSFAKYIRSLDPYKHPITVHNHDNALDKWSGLYGDENFESASMQTNPASRCIDNTRAVIKSSSDKGRPWSAYCDEANRTGLLENMSNRPDMRKNALWGALMAGGAGTEYYFGYHLPDWGDLHSEDWSPAEPMLNDTRHALDFFHTYLPFWEMKEQTEGILELPGKVYAAYRPNGGSVDVDLGQGQYKVQWYNPVTGGPLKEGSVSTVAGGGKKSIGSPPSGGNDWVALITESTFKLSEYVTTGIAKGSDSFGIKYQHNDIGITGVPSQFESVSIYSTQGQLLQVFTETEFSKSRLKPGMYIIRVQGKNYLKSKQLMILR